MLLYITNNESKVPVADQVFDVIEGGCGWIQINTKGISDEKIREIVEAVKPVCIEKEVFLLLNSRVDLAKELNVGGVFLEEGDEPCSHARMQLGPAAVIGVAASSMADVLKVSALDIDFYGLKPFALPEGDTSGVKPLGVDGIAEICKEMESQEINIPKVAMGNIKLEDVANLNKAGVNGIAVSEAIAFADNPEKETELFVKASPKQ